MAKVPFAEMMSFGGSHHGQGQLVVPFKTSKQSLKVLLLHGHLDILVKDAKHLPNMDMFHKKLGDMLSSLPGKVKGKIEGQVSKKITSDPYVTVSVSGAVIGRTFVIRNTENPVWEQQFYVPVAHSAAEVHFVVKDDDIVGSQVIGAVGIPVEQLVSNKRIEGTFPILGGNGEPCKPGAVLSLSIRYIPVENHQGVGPGPAYSGVPRTYFGLRKSGRVTLYQDAHVHKGSLPNLRLEGSLQYSHGSCWRDIFDTISQAQHFVYITGWSVVHKIRLVRDADNKADYMLGDLLKTKSREGVRVLLLVWDDPTSQSFLGNRTEGVMHTSDEETLQFFKHSSVEVLLCPRSAKEGHSLLKQTETGTIYTHHQKTVIVDADTGNNKRKLVAFVGGLDLCSGRYDTPDHHIFRTLQTVHKDDYYNGCFTGPSGGGPRQPWHDMHCRIDGPAAYDVLTNFEERWLQASEPRGIHKLTSSSGDQLLRLDRIPVILGVSDVSYDESDREAWHVQIFRSIDSNSVKGFPSDPRHATSKNLLCGKNILIDSSVQTAYINAIRAAQHFIYIENQYFLGSSYNWDSQKDLGANNLIPVEIALKIASKIKAKQRFSAYIVIPMWPEGVPTSPTIQRILFWQRKTMEMMYRTIHEALVETGQENEYEPQDFLTFFCLGTREILDREGSSEIGGSGSGPPKPQDFAKKNRRFMIYVHSKGMIVDDEYIIIGSANINQRSLEGTRDTEIAMGSYQPHHTYAKRNSYPKGQIHGYRLSLWAEHLGTVEECFKKPESMECMRRLRHLSESNWNHYIADEVVEMKGHLLKYPLVVDNTGKVKPIPGCATFPDVGGKIEGSFIGVQENLTI